MVSHGSRKHHKRSLLSQETRGKGPHRKVQAEFRQRKGQDEGCIRGLGWSALEFSGEDQMGPLKPLRKAGFWRLHGGCLSKAHKGKVMGGEAVSESYQELTFA